MLTHIAVSSSGDFQLTRKGPHTVYRAAILWVGRQTSRVCVLDNLANKIILFCHAFFNSPGTFRVPFGGTAFRGNIFQEKKGEQKFGDLFGKICF